MSGEDTHSVAGDGKKASDRRYYPRYPVSLPVRAGNGLRNIPVQLDDISYGGAKLSWRDILETPAMAMPPGKRLNIEIRADFILPATVLSISETSVHVSFDIDDVEFEAVVKRLEEIAAQA